MERRLFNIAALVLAAGLFSCTKAELTDAPIEEANQGIPMSFIVSHEEDSTKAALTGNLVNWEAGDKILICTQKADDFSTVNGNNTSCIETSEAGASVTFSGTVTPGTTGTFKDWFFAVYPYNVSSYARYNEKDGGVKKLNMFYVPMGACQYGIKDGFSRVASSNTEIANLPSAAMYGVSNVDPTTGTQQLKMKNAYSIIKFKIEGNDVTQVDFNIQGKDIVAERCAVEPTEAPFNWSAHTVVPWSGQANSSTLRVIPENGKETFEPGTYYVSIAPIGGKPTIYIHKNGTMAKITANDSLYFGRSKITPIGVTKALDKIATNYKPIAKDTITLDFTKGNPFAETFPTEATSGAKTFTYNGLSFTFQSTSPTTYKYDGTNKALVFTMSNGKAASILLPRIEGKRVAGYQVVAISDMAKSKFGIGSNNGSATTYSSSTFGGDATEKTLKLSTPYLTPYSSWYFKPYNNAIKNGSNTTYKIKKITLVYTPN